MGEEKINVFFTCQRCLVPLRLDESLFSLNEHVLAELNLPIHSTPDVDLESQATSFDHYVHPCRLSDSGNGANGFTLISDEKEFELLSHEYKVKATLFDQLSGSSHIDHPLCEECTDQLIEILEGQLKETENDYEDYVRYYETLKEEKNEPKLSELEKELSDLKSEETRLLSELEAAKKEELETQKAIEEEEKRARVLHQEEMKYWKEYTRYRKEFLQVDDEARSIDNQLHHTRFQLAKLKNTNIFNATFHIWHSGFFGTINTFRLGRLPSIPVDWSEINAAWGQTVLLLSSLARKIDLTFDRYKLVPYGNHSYVEDLKDQRELPLHGSGGFKFLWDTKFDAGMLAFLDCLQQFQETVEKIEQSKGNTRFRFPYRIQKGWLSDPGDPNASYTIKIQFNSEEQWTKANKFMLTNLKWGLAWIASQFGSEDGGLEEPVEQKDRPGPSQKKNQEQVQHKEH